MNTTLTKRAAVMLAIDELVAFMNRANVEFYAAKYPTLAPSTYEVDGGRKYIRIVDVAQPYGGRSVHCFVDAETGGVYKAAGWKAPALNGERYNLLDPASFDLLKSKWDPYTSYLYKR